MPSGRREAIIQDRRRRVIERHYAPKFRKEFRRMAKQVAVDYGHGGLSRALVGLETHRDNIRELLERLYLTSSRSAIKYLKKVFKKNATQSKETKDSIFDNDDLSGDTAEAALLQLFRKQAFTLSNTIKNTSADAIERAVEATEKAIVEGAAEAEFGKMLRGAVYGVSKSRAEMIARTETGSALMESQFELINDLELPPMIKEWVAFIDGRTRRDHKAVDGDKLKKDEYFNVGGKRMKYPSDRAGGVANVANCRCTLVWEPENE